MFFGDFCSQHGAIVSLTIRKFPLANHSAQLACLIWPWALSRRERREGERETPACFLACRLTPDTDIYERFSRETDADAGCFTTTYSAGWLDRMTGWSMEKLSDL